MAGVAERVHDINTLLVMVYNTIHTHFTKSRVVNPILSCIFTADVIGWQE